jgi:hypothetical protein
MRESLIGQRFGRLVVVAEAEPGKGRKRRWRCQCDCGGETTTGTYNLTHGVTRSCGCLRAEQSRERHLQHGGKGTRLYIIWKNMRQRCNNPKNRDFVWYGARGIKVCEEWDNFAAFRDWALANGYREDLTIDRIDVDGNYEPSNCRWATWREQRLNQRRCKKEVIACTLHPTPTRKLASSG